MARGLCVDCNYDGPLEPMGDCPRCGSEWTTSSEKKSHREDEGGLQTLLGRVTRLSSGHNFSDSGYYEL